MRKAGQRIQELFTPWSDSNLPDAGNWVGRSEQEWIDHTNALRNTIASQLGGFRQASDAQIQSKFDNLVRFLVDEEKYSISGAEEAINKLMRRRDPQTGFLTELDYATAHTNADEQVARLALELSGFENPRFNNKNNVYSTDFVANLGNDHVIGIDAQSTFSPSRSLTLGVVDNVADPLRHWEDNSNVQLGELLKGLRGNAQGLGLKNAGSENKLLQTSDPDVNPLKFASDEFKEIDNNDINKRKDYLIVPHRAGQRSSLMDEVQRQQNPNRRPKARGLYDPTMPNDMSLVSLAGLRDQLINMTPMEMLRKGIDINVPRARARTAPGYGNSLVLNVPYEFYSQAKDPNSMELAKEVLERMTTRG